MAGITGAVSGVLTSSEITSLIQQASAAYQAPVTALQNQEQPILTQISALGQVQGALSGLQSALGQLANVQTLSQRSVTVTPNGAVAATANNSAALGTYSLTGIHLAQAETLISTGYSASSGSLGSGSISIQVGSGSATTIAIASGQDTLGGVASAINQANLGVDASVVFDGSKYHLSLTSDATGTANAFAVTGTGGLAGFSYNATTQNLTETQGAANAALSLNGIAITSGSNNLTGVVQGLSLTLAASGSATISVTQNVDTLVQAAQGVVGSINNALATINKYASFSQTSGAGPLLGDVGLQIVRTDLLNAISSPLGSIASSNSPYPALGSVGFSVTSGGTVTLDTTKLTSAAQTNYQAVAALLGAAGIASNANVSVNGIGSTPAGVYAVNVTGNTANAVVGTVNGQAASGTDGVLTVTGAGPAQGLSLNIANGVTGNLGTVTVSEGLFGTLTDVLNGALDGKTGSVVNEVTNLSNSVSSMNQQITSLQNAAQQQTQLLTQEFSNAQATISQLTTVSSFLTTYFNQTSGSG